MSDREALLTFLLASGESRCVDCLQADLGATYNVARYLSQSFRETPDIYRGPGKCDRCNQRRVIVCAHTTFSKERDD